MLKNYLIISIRNFLKYKFFTLINLSGLVIALACAILIYLFIHQELTFDHFHAHKDRIYKVIAVENNLTDGLKEFTVTQPYPRHKVFSYLPLIILYILMLHRL